MKRGSRVIFSVFEVSPACRPAATFSAMGHAGLNHLRFNGRIHGRALPSGTYQVRARRPGGGTVLHVTLVVLDSPPSPAQLALARAANVCAATRTLSSFATRFGHSQLAVFPTQGGNGSRSDIVRNQNPSSSQSSSGTPSAASPFSPSRVAKNVANPVVIAVFGIAALLLGLAALPQAAVPDPRLTLVLTRHRLELALAGAAALAAGLVSLALG